MLFHELKGLQNNNVGFFLKSQVLIIQNNNLIILIYKNWNPLNQQLNTFKVIVVLNICWLYFIATFFLS